MEKKYNERSLNSKETDIYWRFYIYTTQINYETRQIAVFNNQVNHYFIVILEVQYFKSHGF